MDRDLKNPPRRARTDIWMPVFIGDHLAETVHLSSAQQGGYFLLQIAAWRAAGTLPGDDARLAAIARMSAAEWAEIPDAPCGSAIIAASPAPFSTKATELIEARGLDIELMARLGVGGSDRFPDGIAIPYVEQGAVVAAKHRTLDADKRFTQDAGGKQILWNLDCLADATLAAQPLIATEGELDAVAAIQSGFPRTVSVPGGAPASKQDPSDDLRAGGTPSSASHRPGSPSAPPA